MFNHRKQKIFGSAVQVLIHIMLKLRGLYSMTLLKKTLFDLFCLYFWSEDLKLTIRLEEGAGKG